jgi:hypothetical protein
MYDVRPMDRATAEDIATWRYDPPYSVYDGEADAIESFLEPEYQYSASVIGSTTSSRPSIQAFESRVR